MLDKLTKHHVGIIIDEEKVEILENKFSKKFHLDKTQGTRVLFVYDEDLNMFREYIVKEGRVKNLQLGFAHICYNVPDSDIFEKIDKFIKENKLGYPVTKLEMSASSECGLVRFYFLKYHGLIELNQQNINV